MERSSGKVEPPVLPADAEDLIQHVFSRHRRLLLVGAAGTGKSTLMARLADSLQAQGVACQCITADPGSPAFGVPGALALARRQAGRWQVEGLSAVCSLDAGRFRLPVLLALQQLLQQLDSQKALIIDAPGLVRGVAGAELLHGLQALSGVQAIGALAPPNQELPLAQDLKSLPAEIFRISAPAQARHPGRQVRSRVRTELWNHYLGEYVVEQDFNLDELAVTGTAPPKEQTAAWHGRQVALLSAGSTLSLGEVRALQGRQLRLLLPAPVEQADSLLIRDARRNPQGLLKTAEPWNKDTLEYQSLPPRRPAAQAGGGPPVTVRVGPLDIALVNGVFGDPLLHARLRHQGRSLLFDLGSSEHLSTRVAHQVSDVFITHAHLDHIGGFLWLLRSRVGDFPPCRLFGPVGLAANVSGFLQGALWDRVQAEGPRFEVLEYDGRQVRRFALSALRPEPRLIQTKAADAGVVHAEKGFRVRAVLLDHAGTWVAAYAFEPDHEWSVRRERLAAQGLQAGPWLSELKQQCLRHNNQTLIELPDGSTRSVEALSREFLLSTPGKRLVYATDLADTPDNRERLTALARNAHSFFCEASFREAETDNAARNGHLTTRACGEIASAAGVTRLLPFHFSRRYQDELQEVYDEIRATCANVVAPAAL